MNVNTNGQCVKRYYIVILFNMNNVLDLKVCLKDPVISELFLFSVQTSSTNFAVYRSTFQALTNMIWT